MIRTDWRFVPSAELGGDSFGYHWLDDDHFAFYLLDVSGHGVGSALLSVSAMNALRSQALPQTDFREPGQVLAALNNAFQMDQQNGLFFTIWYGVYHKPTRRIDYSGGGHPPALLFTGPSADQAALEVLESSGPMIGAVPDLEFQTASTSLDAFAKLYLYSDGVYEIERTDKTMWPFNDFVEFMKQGPHDAADDSKMDRLIAHDREIQGRDEFVDDCSIVELQFRLIDAARSIDQENAHAHDHVSRQRPIPSKLGRPADPPIPAPSAGPNGLRGDAICPGRRRGAPHPRPHGRGRRRHPPRTRPGGNLL